MRQRSHRRRDPTQERVLLQLWEDVLRVKERSRSGHNLYYRTEDNPRGQSLAHHRTILPDRENIEAAYVLSDALLERGGKLARLGETLVWFMEIFEEAGPYPERGADNVLEPSEWLDFGYLIGDLTKALGELYSVRFVGWRR